MATIAATPLMSIAPVTVTETILDGTDTFTYDASKKQYLILRNPTAGAIAMTGGTGLVASLLEV